MEVYSGLIELNWTSLMVLANIVILYLILKHFFFEKIHNFMQNRQDAVRDAIDSAEAINRKADAKMENYNKRIANAEAEGRDIVRQAKVKADAQAAEIVEEARKQAGEIIVKAEKTIEREREKATEEMRHEIAALAILAAEKIVEHEIQNIGQETIIDEVIRKARSDQWQN
ncbi:MAG: F0F1 ATP synthase subunit B [Clostridiales bacterium]|nr:F0F1 ATP synthase subunit B [Clostridiales bacterium]